MEVEVDRTHSFVIQYQSMSRESQITPSSATGETEQAPGERRSNLVIVREQILANPGVFYAGEVMKYNDMGGWTQTVDMIVAPVKPIFDVEKLNRFMDGLVEGVPTSARDAAHPQGDGGIHLGKLYYDESIGRRRTETTTFVTPVEAEALQNAGITIGETHNTREEDLQRRTWLRVYPDTLSAQTIFDYEQGVMNGTVEPNSTFSYLQHWIEGEQIRRMKENQGYNPFVRIAGMLRGGKR